MDVKGPVPRPFLRTREEFEMRVGRGMLARLEWLHPADSVIQCSSRVTEKANPGEVVCNSLNSYEWLRAHEQRHTWKRKNFNRAIISAYEAVGVQSLKRSYKSTRMTLFSPFSAPITE